MGKVKKLGMAGGAREDMRRGIAISMTAWGTPSDEPQAAALAAMRISTCTTSPACWGLLPARPVSVALVTSEGEKSSPVTQCCEAPGSL